MLEIGREKMQEGGSHNPTDENKEGLSTIDKPSPEQSHNTRDQLAKDLGWSTTVNASI